MPILYTIPLALRTEQLPRRQGIREHLDLMSGLPLAEQWALFQLVPAEQIRVRLTSSAMVISHKSISMVIGVGQDMPTWTQAEACERCNLKETCRYRVHIYPETTTN